MSLGFLTDEYFRFFKEWIARILKTLWIARILETIWGVSLLIQTPKSRLRRWTIWKLTLFIQNQMRILVILQYKLLLISFYFFLLFHLSLEYISFKLMLLLQEGSSSKQKNYLAEQATRAGAHVPNWRGRVIFAIKKQTVAKNFITIIFTKGEKTTGAPLFAKTSAEVKF